MNRAVSNGHGQAPTCHGSLYKPIRLRLPGPRAHLRRGPRRRVPRSGRGSGASPAPSDPSRAPTPGSYPATRASSDGRPSTRGHPRSILPCRRDHPSLGRLVPGMRSPARAPIIRYGLPSSPCSSPRSRSSTERRVAKGIYLSSTFPKVILTSIEKRCIEVCSGDTGRITAKSIRNVKRRLHTSIHCWHGSRNSSAASV